ncbi:DNA polymerase IV [Jatrophihabitans sp. YIM 134969]
MFVDPLGSSILHADLDSFFASVEQRDDPSLRGRPVAVGGGVVLAASYEAKAHGVRSAMGGRLAKSLCPGLVVVPPRMEAYSQASKDVFAVFHDTSPVVEAMSIDEAFLDVSGLLAVSGTPVQIAGRLRERVREEVGLAITVGVARTKFLAKVASGVAKPDGLLCVPPLAELAFLHALPVEKLWGVGAKTAAKLHERGIHDVGQVAELGPDTLVAMLGPASGRHLFALAHNRDPRRVETGRRRRSIGAQRARRHSPLQRATVDADLVTLVDRTTRRLRSAERTCRTVTLRLRFDDLSVRVTRSHTLARPTDDTALVLSALRALLNENWSLIAASGLSLVGVTLGGLDGADVLQPELPFGVPTRALDGALDAVREKFGTSAVTRGVLLGRDPGIAVPTLPV